MRYNLFRLNHTEVPMPKKRIVGHPERVAEVCGILVRAFDRNEFPYNIGTEPQDMLPERIKADPKTHSLFLFGACYLMRGTIQSDYAFKQLIAIHERWPELFDPEFLSQPEVTVAYVYDRFKEYLKYRLFEIPRLWLDGFRRLKEDWGGDPRNIFDGVEDSAELYRRVVNIESICKSSRASDKLRGFVGFRPKIANMLAYFFFDAALVKEFVTSSPFDFHNARGFIGPKAIELHGKSIRFEHVTEVGSAMVEEYCRDHHVPTKKVAAALWVLSTTLCRNAPGNRTLNRVKSKEANKREGERHKLDYRPQKREQTELKLYEPDWSKPEDVLAHELSCGLCPIRHLCSVNVAAGFYYEDGSFRTQPRTEPLPHLFNRHGLPYHAPEKRPVPQYDKGEVVALPLLPGEWPEQRKPEVQPDAR